MAKKGLMIDYMLCTGCHSCEVSCKLEKGLPTGTYGIKLADDKPWQIDEDTWEYKWIPIPTKLCDLCEDRVAADKKPACVLHCCSHCMYYGTLKELAEQMDEIGRECVLFAIK